MCVCVATMINCAKDLLLNSLAIALSLTDPAFVGSAHIQESLPEGNAVGDDDKIYFFFTETGKEINFFENPLVSRIARVCKVRIRYPSFYLLLFTGFFLVV